MLVLDWDLNGALDLLLLAKPSVKMTFDIIASELYLNKGAGTRHFQLAPAGLTEFCSTALQSDIDGTCTTSYTSITTTANHPLLHPPTHPPQAMAGLARSCYGG